MNNCADDFEVIIDEPVSITDESKGLCSGFGKFATDKIKHPNGDVELDSSQLNTTRMANIKELADNPESVKKDVAQWVIFSDVKTRTRSKQREQGRYYALWADIDENPIPLKQLAILVGECFPSVDYELYTSRSAKENYQKSRIIIPLLNTVSGDDFELLQECLNDWLASKNITPDRASETCNQVCYLPNKGEYYNNISLRDGVYLDGLKHFTNQLKQKKTELAQLQVERIERKKQTEIKRQQRTASGFASPIDEFNDLYPVEGILEANGYIADGARYIHPNSESGAASVSILNGRAHSLSSSDKLYTGGVKGSIGTGEGAHDAFSVFCLFGHNGDEKAAIIDAGNNYLNVGGESWNKVKQREHAEKEATKETTTNLDGMFDVLTNDDAYHIDLTYIDLANPPGITGKICRNMNKIAYRPLPLAYPLYALQLLSTLAAGRKGYGGTKLSLLSLIIAPSASGKELPQKYVKSTLWELKKSEGVVDKPRSDKDMITNLVEAIRYERNLFYVIDEVQGMFNAISDKNAQSYVAGIGDEILKMMVTDLYSLSGLHKREFSEKYFKELKKSETLHKDLEEKLLKVNEADTQAMGEINDKIQHNLKQQMLINKTIDAIQQGIQSPQLGFAGASTPQNLDKIITADNIETGLLGRAIIFREDDRRNRFNDDCEPFFIDSDVLYTLSGISRSGSAITANKEAERLMHLIRDKYEQDQYLNHPILGALYARLTGRVKEISSVLCLENGVITVEHVKYALACAIRHIEDCEYILKRNAAGNSDSAMLTAIKEVILRVVPKTGLANSTIKQRVCRAIKGVDKDIAMSEKKGTTSLLEQAINNLVEQGVIKQVAKRFKKI